MKMPTQQMFGRIAEVLSRNWVQNETSVLPDFNKFTVSPLKGQGATSTCYQLQFADGQGSGSTFFVKKYAEETLRGRRQLETDYRTAKWLAAELGERSVLRVDPPALMIPAERVLVTAYVAGENLSPYFSNRLRWHFLSKTAERELITIAGQIGSGLAELQRIPAARVRHFFGTHETDRFFAGIKSELNKYLDFYAERKICLPLVQRVVKRIEACLDEYQSRELNYCFQHNDYILQNFIVGENGRLQLFDFANSALGIPWFDMAHMLNSLEDLTYLKSVSTPFVEQLKTEFMRPFSPGDAYQPRVLAAMRAYIQIYSGRILLLGTGRGHRKVFHHLALVDPEKRLEESLLALLEELEP